MIIRSRKGSFIRENLEPTIRLAKSYDIAKDEIIAKTNSIYGEEQ
jgi:hypothetical protein